jgi:hypothetical protein
MDGDCSWPNASEGVIKKASKAIDKLTFIETSIPKFGRSKDERGNALDALKRRKSLTFSQKQATALNPAYLNC